MDRSASVTRSGYGVWPQGQALGANGASIPMLLGLKWTEQASCVCLSSGRPRVTAMGLTSSLADRPCSGFGICLWQFYAYLCDLQTGSLDQTGNPTHLSQDVEPECWPWGIIPSQPDMTCQTCFADYICFPFHVSFLTSLHGWLTSFSSLSDPIGPHYFSEPLNQQRSNVDPSPGSWMWSTEGVAEAKAVGPSE